MSEKSIEKRNSGIDLLRAVSMMGIIVLHLLKESGLLEFNRDNLIVWCWAWIFEILAFSSVNVFAMISGFVGISGHFKYGKLAEMWVQVVTYMGIFGVIARIANINFNYDIKDIFFPVSRDYYWYVTAYFGMFFVSPIIRNGIINIKKKQLEFVMIIMLVFICLVPCVLHTDPYKTSAGYSSLWLVICYIFGAYIRLYRTNNSFHEKTVIVLLLISEVFIYSTKIGIDLLVYKFTGAAHGGGTFVTYVSPFIVINSFLVVLLFSKIRIKNDIAKRIIAFFTPATLGVFLIHANPVSGELWFYKLAHSLTCIKGLILLPLMLVIYSSVIYFICSFFELLRIQVMRILGANKLFAKIDKMIEKVAD